MDRAKRVSSNGAQPSSNRNRTGPPSTYSVVNVQAPAKE
jgi:hypothetical protein